MKIRGLVEVEQQTVALLLEAGHARADGSAQAG